MHLTWIIGLLAAAAILYLLFGRKRESAIARGLRKVRAIDAVTSAYKMGDYATALTKTEALKDDGKKSAEYCFFRGSMLSHLGRFDEAESSLREGLPLEENPSRKALVYNTLATVFMELQRYPEAIAFYENAGRAWPDRGANHRGIAEVWLRQGREFPEALEHARQAVDIDRRATGMKKEALNTRLGEDLAVLAWATAVASGDSAAVDALLAEAFVLCDPQSRPTAAEVNYHAARAYQALNRNDKAQECCRKASILDPNGIFGKNARALLNDSAPLSATGA